MKESKTFIENKIKEYQQRHDELPLSYGMIRGSLMIQIRTLKELLDDIEEVEDKELAHRLNIFNIIK